MFESYAYAVRVYESYAYTVRVYESCVYTVRVYDSCAYTVRVCTSCTRTPCGCTAGCVASHPRLLLLTDLGFRNHSTVDDVIMTVDGDDVNCTKVTKEFPVALAAAAASAIAQGKEGEYRCRQHIVGRGAEGVIRLPRYAHMRNSDDVMHQSQSHRQGLGGDLPSTNGADSWVDCA